MSLAGVICAPAGRCRCQEGEPAHYLYAWAGDDDEKDSDFLAVIDADPGSKSYGAVVATAPTGFKATMPHHTEYETPPGGTLFADGWKASHSFVIDVSDPRKPRVAEDFTRAGQYSYPHSFARIPGGHVLATFQSIGDKYAPPGGLVELDGEGRMVRATPSATPDIPTAINWPYSLAVAPGIDRVVTSSTDMGMGPGWTSPDTHHVQVWSLSGLKLLASVDLPDSDGGKHNIFPAEPRFLADGSAYVNTFSCGLYRIEGLTSAKPTAKFVHAFPSGPTPHDMCSVPLVYGKYSDSDRRQHQRPGGSRCQRSRPARRGFAHLAFARSPHAALDCGRPQVRPDRRDGREGQLAGDAEARRGNRAAVD